jgi:hypothetical protein
MPSGSSRRSGFGRRGSTRRPCRCRHAAAPGTTAFRRGKSRRAASSGAHPFVDRDVADDAKDAFAFQARRRDDQADFGGTKYRSPPKNVAHDPTSRTAALGAHMRGNDSSHYTDRFRFYARSLHNSFQLLGALTHVIASIELPEFLHRLSGSRRRSDAMNLTAWNLTACKMNSTA